MENKGQTQYFRIGILSIAHMLNDLYSNYLPQLLPFLLVIIPNFTATRAAVLVSTFTISSSLIQPVFGYFLDQKGQRWMVYVGTLWMAVMLSLTGVVTNYWVLVLLAASAGLGTAAFHPQATTMVNEVSGRHQSGILSVFVAFGNVGYALGPLLLIPLFQTFGLSASVFTVIPGIVVTVLLILFAPKKRIAKKTLPSLSTVMNSLRSAKKELFVVITVIAVRSAAYTGLLTILPLYFNYLNLSNIDSSHLIFIMLIAGAAGGVLGGFVADRFGRKKLTVGSLVAATPLFLAFVLTDGALSVIFLALAGAALLASFAVTVVSTQEVIPDNKALAAGLSLGFAGGIGGLAVIGIGGFADAFGILSAMILLSVLPLAAGLVGLFMKDRSVVPIKQLEA
jgi:FSR family fosmidomycin resistance protein-like MFS transporter